MKREEDNLDDYCDSCCQKFNKNSIRYTSCICEKCINKEIKDEFKN
jgi:hypothetical protein